MSTMICVYDLRLKQWPAPRWLTCAGPLFEAYAHLLERHTQTSQVIQPGFGHFQARNQDLSDSMSPDEFRHLAAVKNPVAVHELTGLALIIVDEANRYVTVVRILRKLLYQELTAVARAVDQYGLRIGMMVPTPFDHLSQQAERQSARASNHKEKQSIQKKDRAGWPLKPVDHKDDQHT